MFELLAVILRTLLVSSLNKTSLHDFLIHLRQGIGRNKLPIYLQL